jgi:hypothetical protein
LLSYEKKADIFSSVRIIYVLFAFRFKEFGIHLSKQWRVLSLKSINYRERRDFWTNLIHSSTALYSRYFPLSSSSRALTLFLSFNFFDSDSHVQELFRKESAIPYLINILLKTKQKYIIYRIVTILGNLSYGISGGGLRLFEHLYNHTSLSRLNTFILSLSLSTQSSTLNKYT